MEEGMICRGNVVCVERHEAPDIDCGDSHHAQAEVLPSGLYISQPGLQKSRGTVLKCGPKCECVREGDFVILPKHDTIPLTREGRIETWRETDLIATVRWIEMPEAAVEMLQG